MMTTTKVAAIVAENEIGKEKKEKREIRTKIIHMDRANAVNLRALYDVEYVVRTL